MEQSHPKLARIIAAIPIERVDLAAGDGHSLPQVGDIVELDQGFSGPSGEPMGIVSCFNQNRSTRWVADILESEMELLSHMGRDGA